MKQLNEIAKRNNKEEIAKGKSKKKSNTKKYKSKNNYFILFHNFILQHLLKFKKKRKN